MSERASTKGREHTPGPWEMVSLSGYGSPFSIRMAYHTDNPNAPSTHYGIQSVRRREDAVLVVAAPDMFEALLTALPYIECAEEDAAYKPGVVAKVTAQIRAALAKAGLTNLADATPNPLSEGRERS